MSDEAAAQEPSETALRVARWADQVRAIAQTGLHYVTTEYDRERYAHLEEIAAQMLGGVSGLGEAEVVARWAADTGYVTPKVGLGAAIHDERGALLLIQRPDSGNWSLPAGFAEVGESPAAGIAREVLEETGLVVVPRRLLGLYDGRLQGSTNPHHIYMAAFVCQNVGGVLVRTTESLAFGYFGRDSLPSPISRSHRRAIEDALDSWREGWTEARFDPP